MKTNEAEHAIRDFVGNAVRSLYQMIMVVNGETLACHVVDYNQELRNISKEITSFDEFSESLYENIHPEDREAFLTFTDKKYFPNELSKQVYTSMECRLRQLHSGYYWSEIIFCNAAKEDSAQGNEYLFLIRDIHEWKTKELREEREQALLIKNYQEKNKKLFEENTTDEMTKCLNKRGLAYYQDAVMDDAAKTGKYIFVCMVDLNGLKYINDNYGHLEGSAAIKAVAVELQKAAPQGALVARVGGDEFEIIAALAPDSKEPELMGKRLDDGLAAYNEAHKNQYTVGASYGYVLESPKEDMGSLDKYVSMADAKMYEMKKARDEHRRS